MVNLHSAPNYGHPSGPHFFPCGLQALRFNFWHQEQGITGLYIPRASFLHVHDVKPMSWRAFWHLFFFSAKRIRDTISELLGSLQWLAISQQKAQLLSGLPSLSLRPDSWEGGKSWNMITSVGFIQDFFVERFQVLFYNHSLVIEISVWSSLWFQKIVTRFWRFDEQLGLPTDGLTGRQRRILYFSLLIVTNDQVHSVPGWQLKQIITGDRPKISKRHRLCTHNRTHNLQLSTIDEGLKSFSREAGEKPPREVGKRVKVMAYKPK